MYEIAGLTAISESVETALIWGGDRNQVGLLQQHGEVFSSSMLDQKASPTTAIRAGMLLGKLTSTGEMDVWDPEAVLGTQDLYGVNSIDFSTLNELATAVDKTPPGPIVRGPLRAASLLIDDASDATMVGHVHEFLAREALHNMGIILDDDPQGYLAGVNWRRKIHTGDLTLTSAMNATRFICHSADADFILPTIVEGLKFAFFMGEDFELQISSPTSVFVTGNDQTGDGVTYTLAGDQIGVHVMVEAINMDIAGTNTPSWIMTQYRTPQSTDDFFDRTVNT